MHLLNDEFSSENAKPLAVVRLATSAAKPRRAQKRFNELVERLSALRGETAQWTAYGESYQQRLTAEYEPLARRLREKRIALARVFDAALLGRTLGRRHADKLTAVVVGLVARLLEEAEDPELIEIHNRHAETSFSAGRLAELSALQSIAGDEFGIDIEDYPGEDTPEAFADWLREQIKAAKRATSPGPDADRAAPESHLNAAEQQLSEGGTRAVRSIFRKLVSELHPDREVDPAARERKTLLMQRVNLAYEADDLLSLLEMQISIEQIDPDTLGALADEQLRHYGHVLEAQLRDARAELADVIAPFRRVLHGAPTRRLTPLLVQKALDADLIELKSVLRSIESELILFKDLRYLKASISSYRLDSSDDLDDVEADSAARRGAPRARGRRG